MEETTVEEFPIKRKTTYLDYIYTVYMENKDINDFNKITKEDLEEARDESLALDKPTYKDYKSIKNRALVFAKAARYFSDKDKEKYELASVIAENLASKFEKFYPKEFGESRLSRTMKNLREGLTEIVEPIQQSGPVGMTPAEQDMIQRLRNMEPGLVQAETFQQGTSGQIPESTQVELQTPGAPPTPFPNIFKRDNIKTPTPDQVDVPHLQEIQWLLFNTQVKDDPELFERYYYKFGSVAEEIYHKKGRKTAKENLITQIYSLLKLKLKGSNYAKGLGEYPSRPGQPEYPNIAPFLDSIVKEFKTENKILTDIASRISYQNQPPQQPYQPYPQYQPQQKSRYRF